MSRVVILPANEQNYRIQLGPLGRLLAAEEINNLVVQSEERELLWKALRERGLSAERQYGTKKGGEINLVLIYALGNPGITLGTQFIIDHTLPNEPSFYVHAPVRVDPSAAPTGQDTLFVLVPVGHLDEAAPHDWLTLYNLASQGKVMYMQRFMPDRTTTQQIPDSSSPLDQ